MRLLRVGPPGRERSCVLRAHGRAVGVSRHVDDFAPSFFARGGLDRLRDPMIGVPDRTDHAAAPGTPVPEESIIEGLGRQRQVARRPR